MTPTAKILREFRQKLEAMSVEERRALIARAIQKTPQNIRPANTLSVRPDESEEP
jgi:hypothetical protein